ncbi:hypothetical protein SAMN05444273_101313 [Litoreibacter ascidiaceicola]|uniref:Uncharacterized protein n=1 Tax=Litoreibacter ascidiaceicola TaxID=1486859 RepID=A0A1M4T675_9RHOB|nr:hypothetical protein [Litoreibacter ascidiaceicola]SHE39817.1 hypothetical protein SAMN05444273_101313 [Litoreibacter ascidiaceicola]
MAELLFEIWECKEEGSFECSMISEQADRLRKNTNPNSVLLSTFSASSYLESGQKNYDFHEYGDYDLGPVPNQFYSEEDALEQQEYLKVRVDWK